VLPVVVTFPGFLVSVHVPDGNPFSFTEPVATEQVGWVIVLIVGAAGIAGAAFTTTFPVAGEVQPAAFITLNVYVPALSPLMVVDVVLPVVVAAPGFLVIVQVPDGNPFNTTEPVVTVQPGCVMLPTCGAVGVDGCGFTTAFAETGEVQPAEFLTVNV